MLNDKKVLAFIPTRGDSKNILGKNIKLLGCKPLILYTIIEALNSKYIDDVLVSTYDKEIVEIAKNFGAEVPFLRPAEFAQDISSSLSVVLHTLEFLETRNIILDRSHLSDF